MGNRRSSVFKVPWRQIDTSAALSSTAEAGGHAAAKDFGQGFVVLGPLHDVPLLLYEVILRPTVLRPAASRSSRAGSARVLREKD